jgi:hypothetical protein
MNWLTIRIKAIMIVAGLLTCTMFYVAVAPEAALQSNFGSTLSGPAAEIVVRNWGVLIGLIGLGLLYGAFNPEGRRLALWLATASKSAFIGLVLIYGQEFLDHQVGVSVVVDAFMVLVFLMYLFTAPRTATVSQRY